MESRAPTVGKWHVGLLLFLLLGQTACEVNSEEEEKINEVFNPTVSGPNIPPPLVNPPCQYERFIEPAPRFEKKLDLLFVVDTSGSINAERGDIADGIDAFLNKVPTEVDLQIGVMLAHGDLTGWGGKLYQKNTEPLTLKTSELTNSEIQTHLRTKMQQPAGDSETDGGELGLHSLKKGITDHLVENQNAGFFRDESALAVVFVADENDICAQYPPAVTPVFDPNLKEGPAKAKYCSNITPQGVVQDLRNLQGQFPLAIGGIIYNDLALVPPGGENEFGYGYAETIFAGNGVSFGLHNGHYNEGLENIANLTVSKFTAQTEFTLQGTNIDPGTVQVFQNGNAIPFSFDPILNTVNISNSPNPISPLDVIDVTYCPFPQHPKVSATCTAGQFVRKPTIKVGLSIDPNEGSINTIVSGFTNIGFTPTVYTDTEIENGKPTLDNITVLAISRKVVLNPVSGAYIQGVINFIQNGGSVIGEYDAAALFFDDFQGSNPIIPNFNPALELFLGDIRGGGVLIPPQSSTTYITNTLHPIMQGMPSSFYLGLRTAFAVSDYDAVWLEKTAEFISTGTGSQVPAGTYPAVLSGRCGPSRVVLVMMNHFNTLGSPPVNTMVSNMLRWITGN